MGGDEEQQLKDTMQWRIKVLDAYWNLYENILFYNLLRNPILRTFNYASLFKKFTWNFQMICFIRHIRLPPHILLEKKNQTDQIIAFRSNFIQIAHFLTVIMRKQAPFYFQKDASKMLKIAVLTVQRSKYNFRYNTLSS